MRREFTLDATHNQFTVELTFTPSTIIILNNTDKSVYLTIGGTQVPNATFFNREILPTASGIPSNVALPNNSYQFAGFLPTPSDATKNVKIIFQGTADPFSNRILTPARGSPIPGSSNFLMGGGQLRNYMEYRLNAAHPRQVMELSFVADMMFILNNSDATLYLQQGATGLPNAEFNDLGIPPKSYTILNPHGQWQSAAFLDSPSEKDCFIIYAYGYADEYQQLKQELGDWDWYLPPLTLPELQWYFDWNFSEPIITCGASFDFRLSDFGFVAVSNSAYNPGVGWQFVSDSKPTTRTVIGASLIPGALIKSVDFVYSANWTGFLNLSAGVAMYLGGVQQYLAGDNGQSQSAGNLKSASLLIPNSGITGDELRFDLITTSQTGFVTKLEINSITVHCYP